MTMSTEADHARQIAERVAKRVSNNPSTQPRATATEVSAELAAVRSTLSELQQKLVQIEARMNSAKAEPMHSHSSPSASARPVPLTHSPWLAGVNAGFAHPSQERFGVEEAAVTELVDFFEKEKTCTMEPGGKPCDHCAMCSTRGF
jgi:hypothetical protein